MSRTHGTMGLYYVLLDPWAAISEHPVWLRLPSLIFMAAAVVMLSLTVARQAGANAGRLAGILAGSTFLIIRYAVEVRSYGLVALLATLGWYSLDRYLEDETDRRWLGLFALTAVLLPLAHGLGTLQVVAQCIALVWARPRDLKRLLAAGLASVAVLGGLALWGASSEGVWVRPLSVNQVLEFTAAVLLPLPVGLFIGGWGGRVMFERLPPSSLASDALSRFRQVSLLMWGPGAAVGLFIMSIARPSLVDRYAIASVLGFSGLVAVGLLNLKFEHGLKLVMPVIVAVVAIGSIVPLASAPATWSAAVSYIEARVEVGDGVIFGSPDSRMPFEAAWVRRSTGPDLSIVGPGDPLGRWDQYGMRTDLAPLIESALAEERIWIVEQPRIQQVSRLQPLLSDPRIRARFQISDPKEFADDISVHLLTAR